MDILNWLYLRKEQLIRKTANNPETDLVAVGADVTFAKRDDKYKTYAMPIKDLSVAGNVANTGYYTVDFASTFIVDVTTQKGVIEITMDSSISDLLPPFDSAIPLVINNVDMDFSNADNIYIQTTPYYYPEESNDSFIPYVLPTGFIPLQGATFAIFNASSTKIGQITGWAASASGVPSAADQAYTYLPAQGGTGNGALFTIIRDALGNASVQLVDGGTDYVATDVLTIPGTWVGGASPADDISITVNNTSNDFALSGRFYIYYELYNF